MIIIDSEKSILENKLYLDCFESIYLQSFPDELEREEFSDILLRVKDGKFPKSIIVLETDIDILGGMIIDIYNNSIFHLTYLITNPSKRQTGVANKLIQCRLKELIELLESDASGVFIETNIPHKTSFDSFDPETRVKIFNKLNIKWIPIDYIQPPLDKSKSAVSNLYLLYYPIVNRGFITRDELIQFLNSLYLGLDQSIDCQYLKQIKKKLLKSKIINLQQIPTN